MLSLDPISSDRHARDKKCTEDKNFLQSYKTEGEAAHTPQEVDPEAAERKREVEENVESVTGCRMGDWCGLRWRLEENSNCDNRRIEKKL